MLRRAKLLKIYLQSTNNLQNYFSNEQNMKKTSEFKPLTTDSMGGSPPASINKTLQFVISLKRVATIEPEEPAPITMKSYTGKSKKKLSQNHHLL